MRTFAGMADLNTFFTYYGRFFREFREDFVGWPRDNVIVAGIAAIGPPLTLYVRNPAEVPDWELIKTTLWIYLILFGVYAIFHLLRTPWKMDANRTEELKLVQNAEAESKVRLAELKGKYEDARPRLTVRVLDLSERAERGFIPEIPLQVRFLAGLLSGREPTSVQFDPISSFGGNFTLFLGRLPFIRKDAEPTIPFEVWRHGQRPTERLLSAGGWGKMLTDFLWDSRVEGGVVAFPLIARFLDGHDSREQRFRLIFNHSTYRFEVTDELPEYILQKP